jgi:hypothetical protein
MLFIHSGSQGIDDMATDPSGHTVGGTAMRQDPAPNGSTPRWVKVFGVVTLIGVLVFIMLHFMGGAMEHGIDMGGHTSPPGVTQGGVKSQ